MGGKVTPISILTESALAALFLCACSVTSDRPRWPSETYEYIGFNETRIVYTSQIERYKCRGGLMVVDRYGPNSRISCVPSNYIFK